MRTAENSDPSDHAVPQDANGWAQVKTSGGWYYRTAADVLEQMFPVDAGAHHETLRRHTLKVGEALGEGAAIRPETAASAIVVTLDSTFIRSCTEGERHLKVRVGNVETASGGRQVFDAVAKADTDIQALIRRTLDAVGRTEDTALTAFTDGCPRLRHILADAGVTTPLMLDWFHVAMRLQHLKQFADGMSADDPARGAAKAVIVEEVERLHWRIWNGKARDALASGSTLPVSSTAGVLAASPRRSCSVMACTSETARPSSPAICHFERFMPMKKRHRTPHAQRLVMPSQYYRISIPRREMPQGGIKAGEIFEAPRARLATILSSGAAACRRTCPGSPQSCHTQGNTPPVVSGVGAQLRSTWRRPSGPRR